MNLSHLFVLFLYPHQIQLEIREVGKLLRSSVVDYGDSSKLQVCSNIKEKLEDMSILEKNPSMEMLAEYGGRPMALFSFSVVVCTKF